MRQYPKTKFADENSVLQQIKHIKSEIREFANAWDNFDRTWDLEAKKSAILEAHDIIQSTYTLMDILEREYPGQAWSALDSMIEKNRKRGYYQEES